MRLKTPLFLALIIGPLLAIIFLIWPEYQKIAPQNKALKDKETLVASIRQKNSNIANLTRSLEDPQNVSGKNFVMGYLPLDKKEELIFNSINDIADAEGVKVALSNVSVQVAKEEGAATSAVPLDPALADPMAAENQPVSVLPAVKTIRADISTVGSYEGQKNFIAKLYALDMFKKIASFNLSSGSTAEGGSGNVISGTIVAEFNFIPEAKIGKDYNSPIFSVASFDFGSVEKLRALLSQKASEVPVSEGSGRANPFLP